MGRYRYFESVSVFGIFVGIGVGIGIFEYRRYRYRYRYLIAHCPTVLFGERERFSRSLYAIVCLSSVTFVHPTQVIDLSLIHI